MIKFLIISFISGIISSMGIGGGRIFILLTTIFNIFKHKEAQGYNLIMFILVGISSTIFNFKNNNIDKNMFKKLIIPICIGSICGILLVKIINENILRYIFYSFMVIIGIYEIITSLRNIIKTKNNK